MFAMAVQELLCLVVVVAGRVHHHLRAGMELVEEGVLFELDLLTLKEFFFN
jgi:hypothetical protein